MIEQGGRPEKSEKEGSWQEGRRATLQAVRNPINLLVLDITHIEDWKKERQEAHKPIDSLEVRQHELIRVLNELSHKLQLSVGVVSGQLF